ncbi:DUF1501 domain-containing protein [Rubripirellula reticaptiva]|uniref:Sulfatase n=1 Tax=Rubripirellula reticaptiva TaxID=2528013 RepID=A0A5C6EAN4_9BACT|nr:DUF1501 domain-containing protein [Rubripirellula reticaptiva]TWU46783.1 hypothetical protein Poly59_57560 [Rubripirellula reticaptiva]
MTKTWTNCEGLTRRDGLKLGLGGLIAGGLSGALGAKARASEKSVSHRGHAQADACILVWLDGGPSHYETFDPKPDAPVEIRGAYQPIATQTPGVQFAQPMTKLAAISNDLAIVRSIRHDQGNHGAGNHYMMTGAPPRIPVGCGAFVSFHPSMGSVVSKEIGAPHGIPAYFSLPSMSRSGGPNFLGSKYAPFVVPDSPNSSSFRVRDVTVPGGLTEGRFGSRQEIRQQIDTMLRFNDASVADPTLAVDEFYRQSMQIIRSKEAQAAFDVHQESDAVRDAYGRNTFGQQALLARRLVGAGVPFVTLYHGGWDHHADIFKSLDTKLPPFEATIAALISDLKQQGMLERTLVVVLGEFGRTPKINDRGGRDHWSNAMSVLFAGGQTRGGQIVGATDRQGYAAIERVLSPENFVSTIYRKLGIDPGQVMYSGEGRPVHLVSDANPIEELMS